MGVVSTSQAPTREKATAMDHTATVIDSTATTRLVTTAAGFAIERAAAGRWFPVMHKTDEMTARRTIKWLAGTIGEADQLSAETLASADFRVIR